MHKEETVVNDSIPGYAGRISSQTTESILHARTQARYAGIDRHSFHTTFLQCLPRPRALSALLLLLSRWGIINNLKNLDHPVKSRYFCGEGSRDQIPPTANNQTHLEIVPILVLENDVTVTEELAPG